MKDSLATSADDIPRVAAGDKGDCGDSGSDSGMESSAFLRSLQTTVEAIPEDTIPNFQSTSVEEAQCKPNAVDNETPETPTTGHVELVHTEAVQQNEEENEAPKTKEDAPSLREQGGPLSTSSSLALKEPALPESEAVENDDIVDDDERFVWGIVPQEELPAEYSDDDIWQWIFAHPDDPRASRFYFTTIAKSSYSQVLAITIADLVLLFSQRVCFRVWE